MEVGRRLTWAEKGKWEVNNQAKTSSKPNVKTKRIIRVKGEKMNDCWPSLESKGEKSKPQKGGGE